MTGRIRRDDQVLTFDLECGVLVSAAELRESKRRDTDSAVLDERALWHLLVDPVPPQEPPPVADTVETWLRSIAELLARYRPVMFAVLLAPSVLEREIRHHCGTQDAIEVWSRLFWIAEATWIAIGAPPPRSSGYLAGDHHLLRPLAARMRFLVLSEPFRHRGQHACPGYNRRCPWQNRGRGERVAYPLTRVLGRDSWVELAARCREARATWLHYLDAYQQHHYLANARPDEFETELDALVFRMPELRTPLVLSSRPLDEVAPPTRDDQAIIAAVVNRHYLPRFQLLPAARLAGLASSNPRVTVTSAAVAAVVAVLALAGDDRFGWAATAACLTYVIGGVGLLAFGEEWITPWLLRMPAASAVGLVALLPSLTSTWLNSNVRFYAPVVLIGAAYGYLLVSCRNHGTSPAVAVRRALAVLVVGAVHSILIALIGLTMLAPSIVGVGLGLAAAAGHAARAWELLAFAGPWCLAVGVFTQILWNDRAITAPLARMRWTREE